MLKQVDAVEGRAGLNVTIHAMRNKRAEGVRGGGGRGEADEGRKMLKGEFFVA